MNKSPEKQWVASNLWIQESEVWSKKKKKKSMEGELKWKEGLQNAFWN